MSVRVSAGTAYVTATPTGGNSQIVRVYMSTFEDVTISANATGSTRYDWIYLKIDPDKLAAPGVNKDDVATLVTSRSTSSATDDGGTGGTYNLLLGKVTVANGASSITNSNITDSRTSAGMVAKSLVADNNNIVLGNHLATSAITLGYAQITANATTTSTTGTAVGLSVTITVPAGGRRLRISVFASSQKCSVTGNSTYLQIWDGTVGSGTQIAGNGFTSATANFVGGGSVVAIQSGLTAGASKTYNVGFATDSGTGTMTASSTFPAFILVEAI